MTGVYRIAGHDIAIESNYETVQLLCEDYRTDAEPELTLSVSTEELTEILRKARENYPELPDSEFLPPDYLELAVIYKRLAERTPFWDTVMLHGSAVAVDGACYVFCAKSGTGKSTHARLWRQLLGERAVMVNDDKPMVHIRPDGSAEVYGTPWDGKHRLNTNTHVPLRAICILERSEENTIRPITKSEAWPMLLQQFYRPYDAEAMEKTMDLIGRLQTSFYRLGCNMELEAAELSYQTMKG